MIWHIYGDNRHICWGSPTWLTILFLGKLYHSSRLFQVAIKVLFLLWGWFTYCQHWLPFVRICPLGMQKLFPSNWHQSSSMDFRRFDYPKTQYVPWTPFNPQRWWCQYLLAGTPRYAHYAPGSAGNLLSHLVSQGSINWHRDSLGVITILSY